MRLHVGVVGAEQRHGTLDRQRLGFVDVFAAAVVALAGIALGVLVGQDRTLRGHDALARIVFGGDQFDVLFLPALFLPDGLGEFGVEGLESGSDHSG